MVINKPFQAGLPGRFRLLTILSGTLFVASLPALAWGQATPSIPAQQNPGILTPSPSGISPDGDRIPQGQGQVMDEIRLDVPEATKEDRLMSPAFLVNRIKVEGSTLFSPEELRAMVAPYENREQSLTDIGRLAEDITARYRERGYLTSQAYIPPQDIVDGNLIIQVREGHIGKIQIEGNKYYRAHLVTRSLQQEPGELLNFRTLEQDLNQSNRVTDGYKLKAQLTAGEMPGETDVRIQVAEKLPFQISPTFDNQGRPFIGMYRHGVEFRHNSVTGIGDRFYGRWIGASGTQIAMGSYAIPLNKYGTELAANFAFSRVNLDLGVQNPPEIIGKAYNYGLSLSQPLTADRSLVADIGANWRSIDTYFDGEQTEDTEIRSIEAGLNFNKYDRWGRTYNRVQGTVAASVLNGTSRFFKLENYFTRVFTLPKRNMVILRAYGQITPDSLPAAEQFQIGGAYSVRGYSEGLLIGDRGYNFSIEHQFPIPGMKYVSPWLDERVRGTLFYDVGRVWLDKSNPFYVAGQSDKINRTLLQSVGFGLRAQITRFAQGFIDVGFGLNNRDEIEPLSQPTARIHFGVRSDLFADNYQMRGPSITPYVPRRVSLARP